MAYVTIGTPASIHEDVMRWARQRLHQYADELGVKLKGAHLLEMTLPGVDFRFKLRCSCGWEHSFPPARLLTTGSPIFHDALKEHVLSFTDPTHYTYYPKGV